MALSLKSSCKVFGGILSKYTHESISTKTLMTFSVFLPKQAENNKVNVLYYLSGLTCNEDNFMQKSGAQRVASELGVAIVCPDTSPRGTNINGEHDNWDFGSGAGFYVNATQPDWSNNYNMYQYVTEELPSIVESSLSVTKNKSIFGHSMGGHGALICYLKNPGMYASVSAFAPICNPINCAWGQKAFSGYLGDNKDDWKAYDATELLKSYNGPKKNSILIDQGSSDQFLKEGQLLPENFEEVAKSTNTPVDIRMQDGYDHSYYFISTFVEDHIRYHASVLNQ